MVLQFVDMTKVERFEDLRCWQSARSVVYTIYQLKKYDTLSRDYDTFRQLKRAALSIMNNIAEGFARYHHREFIQFLNIAQSSAVEVKSMLYVLEDLEYCLVDELRKVHLSVDNTRKSILSLIRYIQKKKSDNYRNQISESAEEYIKATDVITHLDQYPSTKTPCDGRHNTLTLIETT